MRPPARDGRDEEDAVLVCAGGDQDDAHARDGRVVRVGESVLQSDQPDGGLAEQKDADLPGKPVCVKPVATTGGCWQ
jgi:hypothetical protein